ncbi:MAG: heterodisulfide reductase-related iron-sulfur binding cluster [Phycisphaerae bacterium]|nr:heterodisulfide reductase-related iron-sulfur binding cluster [Phycisphaerae bacterium]
MQHQIPIAELGPTGEAMAGAVQACVHCGFCLPTCPTYQVLGQEMDSPRGRIVSMRGVLEGHLPLEQALPHVDACLGCLACETACPSGVAYRDLLSPFRAHAEQRRHRPFVDRLKRWMLMATLPYPRRFRLALKFARLARPARRLLPASFQPLLDLLPHDLSPKIRLPAHVPAEGLRRGRVALLTGCAQQVLDADINLATIDVLSRNGVEVLVPRGQVCCGALAWHVGEGARCRRLARRNLSAFPMDVDAVVTNAAGCGSAVREYGTVFRGHGEEDAASALAERTIDAAAYLQELGITPPPSVSRPLRIAYQDACHLLHGQGVRDAPRELLRSIDGLELVELAEAETCCGSAGTYNLDQPRIAAQLGRRKAETIIASGCDLVASGNIGCMVQLRLHLERQSSDLPVRHTMQVLRDAYDRSLGPRR